MSTEPTNNLSVFENLKTWIQYPFLALVSKQFYYKVLFELRGLGGSYLLFLSLALAIPASFKVLNILGTFRALDLPHLVTQIPPSYINRNGIMSPNDPSSSFLVINNSHSSPVIIYNPENRSLDNQLGRAPFELQSDGLIIRGTGQSSKVPYQTFVGTDISFEPVATATMLESVLASTFFSIWPMVTLWFFVILWFNTIISGAISRFLVIFFIKLRLDFRATLRLAAFANTSIAILLLLQFYIYFPIPFTIMCLIPILYLVGFCKLIRQQITKLGNEALKSGVKLKKSDFMEPEVGSEARTDESAANDPNRETNEDLSPRNDEEIAREEREEREERESLSDAREETPQEGAEQERQEPAGEPSEGRHEVHRNDNGRGGMFTP